MASVNKVILIGNLGRDPEKRSTATGTSVATLSVATAHSYVDSQTKERRENTEWNRVVLYGQPADFATQYARKGNMVYVEGRLQTRKWEDQRTGQDRYTTEIIGNEFRLLERRSSAGSDADSMESRPSGDSGRASEPVQPPISDDRIDDIPW